MCDDASLSEEYVQETFMRFFQSGYYRTQEVPKAMERALLSRILANVVIDASKKLRRERQELQSVAVMATVELPSYVIEDRDLYWAIGQLSVKIRTTMWLFLEGLRNTEIARLQHISAQTVAKRLFDGREKLRQLLAPKGPV